MASGLMAITDMLGLTNQDEQKKATTNAKNTLMRLRNNNEDLYSGEDGIISKINANKDSIISLLGGEESVQNYLDNLEKQQNFSYDKTVDQFMDPAAQYQIDQSVKATQNAMAGQGGLSGGAAAAQLQAVASEKANELYKDAAELMNKDKEFEYKTLQDSVNNSSKLAESYMNTLQNASEEEINALIAQFANYSNMEQGIAQADVDYASNGSSLLGLLKGIFS